MMRLISVDIIPIEILDTGLVSFLKNYRETVLKNLATRASLLLSDCQEFYIVGFDPNVLGRGDLHYTLDTLSKVNKNTAERIENTVCTNVFWSDSSRVMYEVYTAEQFLLLYKEASIFMMMQNFLVICLEQTLRKFCQFAYNENENAGEEMKE